MGGVTLRDDELVVERSANELDELAIAFSEILSQLDIDHVFIAGYIAILTGRARATDDIDVLIERLPESDIVDLVETLEANDYWGPAMPLEEMYENLSAGTNIWVAPDDQMTPHLEVKFPTDEFDRASLANAIDAHIADATIPIGPLELQIAYKLYLGSRTDFEDAAHLYALFRESLRTERLESWVEKLDVHEQYAQLESI
jgi:predicted nucleotidyltransferase